MTATDRRLVPEGWAPKPGYKVRINPETNPAPDAPPPPPGVWWVVDRAPEGGAWWVMPADGESRVWGVVAMAGRARDSWPAGWPAQSVQARRLVPASMAVPLC